MNLLVWLCVSLWGLILSSSLLRRRRQGGKAAVLLFAGAALMSLPWLWTPEVFRSAALYRLAMLWALAGLLGVLMQFPVRGGLRRALYGVVVVAGLIQLALSVLQLVWPALAGQCIGYDFAAANGRPLGSLLHVNLLGSFMATALGCALCLALTRRSMEPQSPVRSGLGWCVLLLSVGLMLTQSRSALAGGLITVVALLCLLPGAGRRGLLLCVVVGLLMGQGVLMLRPAQIVPVTSLALSGDTRPADTQARLDWARSRSGDERQMMLTGTLSMIRMSPYTGHGLATFETAFPEAMASTWQINPFTVTVPHPHNELLYVMAEGGVVALAGLSLWLAIWGLPFVRLAVRARWTMITHFSFWRPSALQGRQLAARGALTLPLMVHVMTEYPLWLSAVHAVLLIMLLWLALPVSAKRPSRYLPVSVPSRALLCGCVVAASVAGVIFMATALQSARSLREAESFQLVDVSPLNRLMNPYAQPDRLLFDQAVGSLMQFNQTEDEVWLARFQVRANRWLRLHNDANLTATMLLLSTRQQDWRQAQYWRNRGCMSFISDPRFHCEEPLPMTSLNGVSL